MILDLPDQCAATARTAFVRRSLARAVVPRWQERARALVMLEAILARPNGPERGRRDHLVAGLLITAYPISYIAIRLELEGHGAQALAQIAEQLELTPPAHGCFLYPGYKWFWPHLRAVRILNGHRWALADRRGAELSDAWR